jgi:hypothetical protein
VPFPGQPYRALRASAITEHGPVNSSAPALHLAAHGPPGERNDLREAQPGRANMNHQQDAPGGATRMPSVVSQYAAYLRARAHKTPEITVNGDQADARVSMGDRELILLFRRNRKNEWVLRSAEVRHGAQTATFARGQLMKATAVLLSDEPPPP